MDATSFIDDTVLFSIIFTFVSYVIKLWSSPSKQEIKYLSRFVAFMVLFLIKRFRAWHRKHPSNHHVHFYLDKIYSNVFGLNPLSKETRPTKIEIG